MKFETKFNVGQKIWTLIDHKAKNVTILKVEVSAYDYNEDSKKLSVIKHEINYFVNKGTPEKYESEIIKEENIYLTREELIENL